MSVPVQHPMYIDGQFVTWRGDAWIDVVNPATEAVISRIPDGQAEDARKAIDAAERAQPEWEALPAIERASWLRKISAGIRKRASEISTLIVEEGGKIQQLAEVEVAFTADYIDYMAEWARRYEGEIIQSDRPGENILLFKRALGVTTGILPWNFPFFLIARKMAPALMNDFISMQKDVGMISTLGAVDAVRAAQIVVAKTYNFTPYVAASVLFILLSVPFILINDRYTANLRRREQTGGTV